MMKTFAPKTQNSTFRGDINGSNLNACVGQNGQPDYQEYANGFGTAASILLERVIAEDIEYSVDELVYPIVFTMRHAVELRLKNTVSFLEKLSIITSRKIEVFEKVAQHDIGIIFNYIKETAPLIDQRYQFHIVHIAEYIDDISEVDPTGQTFRYPYDVDGKNKHLEEVGVINVCVLQKRFEELEKLLTNLHQLNIALIEEYNQKSFTLHLSRLQLFQLAGMLPSYSAWVHQSFDNVRDTCQNHFNLSKKELSKALNIIKKHYELAPSIDISLNLLAAREDDLILFFDQWLKLHASNSSSTNLSKLHYEAIAHHTISYEVMTAIENTLSANTIADIQSLFEFARCPVFSEYYVQIYENNRIDMQFFFEKNRQEYCREISDIISKTNALEQILKSLYRLHQVGLVKRLEQRYEAHIKKLRLDSVRDGSYFRQAEILQYR